jgi:hypothetical protein
MKILLLLILLLLILFLNNTIKFTNLQIDYSCIIVGTARDISGYVNSSINTLKRISKLFKYCPIVIYENDSKDDTLEKLKSIENITVISEKNVPGNRTTRLAYARNKLHQYSIDLNYPFDYYIVCDLDDKISKLTPESILTCFKHSGWSMMGANQESKYYDIWALRTFDDWCDHDCWNNKDNKLSCKFKKISKNDKLIPVKSCFGGTGIYKFKDTIGCVYKSIPQEYNPESCEHVSFHEDMVLKHNAKLFINPEMINS